MMADLEAALRARVEGGGKVFVPYVTGGLEGVDADLLRAIAKTGADAIEVGIPFSDPVMDGGVIQEASARSLGSGTRPGDVLATIAEAAVDAPVCVMTYLNPVMAHGIETFLREAAQAGVAGLIVPDLPVDEADEFRSACMGAGIAPVFLAAPGTATDRIRRIAEASRGFVYCVATYGVTGERDRLEGTAREVVESLRPLTDRPLVVGVGIGSPEQAAEACTFADGVVVGSALVRPLVEGARDEALALATEFRDAIRAR